MQVGNVSANPEQVARQRFALLADAQQSGGLVMLNLGGDYFACAVVSDPNTKQDHYVPLARILTGVAESK